MKLGDRVCVRNKPKDETSVVYEVWRKKLCGTASEKIYGWPNFVRIEFDNGWDLYLNVRLLDVLTPAEELVFKTTRRKPTRRAK
jgi:hypothetical protein